MSSRSSRPALATLAIGCALAVSATACASLGPLTAPPDDYAAYRSTRVGATFEARLAAAASYLERFPKGEFEPQVRAYYEEAEPVFFAAKSGSSLGLDAYLRVLPGGPHSEQARTDLRRLLSARSDEEELRGATVMGERLSILAAERARVRMEIESWLRRFLDGGVWRRPLVEAPADLIVAWSLGLPPPVCGVPESAPPDHARRCSKIVELPYTVTGESGPEELQATIEVVVVQDEWGRPLEATIGGPDLFLRLDETFTARAASYDDSARRLSGVSRAVDLVRLAFQGRVSEDPACRVRSASPIVLRLACEGFRVTVRSGTDGEDDTITLVGPGASSSSGPGPGAVDEKR